MSNKTLEIWRTELPTKLESQPDRSLRHLLYPQIHPATAGMAENAEIEVKASQWRLVEVGRVVLFTHGQYTGRLAAIVEIIDHKRALVDGPSKKENAAVPRQSVALNNLIITPIVIAKLPRAAGRGAVARAWEKAEVEKKWDESAWAKRREQREKRRNLSDFDRFKVLRLKKQARFEVRKAHAKVRASAKSSS